MNAPGHRDYTVVRGAVSAAIHDARLETRSEARLPFGPKPEEWGRGTQMIVDLCVRAGHPEPGFVTRRDAFGVRFLPGGYVPPHRIEGCPRCP